MKMMMELMQKLSAKEKARNRENQKFRKQQQEATEREKD